MEAGVLLGTGVPSLPLSQKPRGLSPVCLILPALFAHLLILLLGVWPDESASDAWFPRPQT